MKVNIKRVDKGLPLPEYKTEGAVAFDVYAREETVIEPRAVGLVPTNLIVAVPEGYVLVLKDRGSTPVRKGLLSHVGFIDQDFRGDEDEIMMQFYNYTDTAVTIERGERVGQAALIPVEKAEWVEVEKMADESRGGFGSTGSK